ncbi:MAG: hypothetical protein WD266_11635 [Balneolales bacterium]
MEQETGNSGIISFDSGENGSFTASHAFAILHHQLDSICNVTDWALKAGCSRGWLCTQITRNYGLEPKKLLRQTRYLFIHKYILEDSQATSFLIATKVGLKDDRAMYKFLSTYYQTDFTKLRRELRKAREHNREAFPERTEQIEYIVYKKDTDGS